MRRSVRRVVTGHNAEGQSVVVSDGPAPLVHLKPNDPDWYSTDVFRTDGSPARIVSQPAETTEGPRRQLPAKCGSVIRVNHFPPESEAIRNMTAEESQRTFASLGNEAAATFAKSGRHPLMHRTETIDYAIVLSGEITMLLDESEVLLKAGDILVQCGTNHAWSNRSNAPAVVCFVLIDGEFDAALGDVLKN